MADAQQTDEGGAADEGGNRGGWLSAEVWQTARQARRVTRLARQVGTFARAHGGAQAHVAHLGRKGVRIVLVGVDGHWGDLVTPSDALAREAAELAGVSVQDTFTGDLAAAVRTGSYEWSRMAGIQLGGR